MLRRRIKFYTFKEKLKRLPWVIFQLSGLRLIWYKIWPPNPSYNMRPASSIMLWIVSIYFAVYGIAYTRYEGCVNELDRKMHWVYAQFGQADGSSVISRLVRLQNSLCPVKPDVFSPLSVVRSYYAVETYKPCVNQVKSMIEDMAKSLDGVDLSAADLEGCNLWYAEMKRVRADKGNFRQLWMGNARITESIFTRTDFSNSVIGAALHRTQFDSCKLDSASFDMADLSGSSFRNCSMISVGLWITNCKNASFIGSDLRNANLSMTILDSADLRWCDLRHAVIDRTQFEGANLAGANLQDIPSLNVGHLHGVKSLYKTLLPNTIMSELQSKYPEKFTRASSGFSGQ